MLLKMPLSSLRGLDGQLLLWTPSQVVKTATKQLFWKCLKPPACENVVFCALTSLCWILCPQYCACIVMNLCSDLHFNLTTDGLINSQNKPMLWDYRISVICDPRLMGDQCVIIRALVGQARLIWPVPVPKIQRQYKAEIAWPIW